MELPRIELNLWDYKLPIILTWTVLFITCGVLPVLLYFALRYGAHLALAAVLGIVSAVFGVVSLLSLIKRSWTLLKMDSTCRPLNGSRWAMDYFNWCFIVSFIGITAFIVAGNVVDNIRLIAIGLPVLITFVSAQILIAFTFASTHTPAPITISSVRKGELVRSGIYAITEDVVAVDGGRGQVFREQLEARYHASQSIRDLFHRLDLLWGTSGLGVGAITIGLLFGLKNHNVAYILGWTIPWAYAVAMAGITRMLVKSALKSEKLIGVSHSLQNGGTSSVRSMAVQEGEVRR